MAMAALLVVALAMMSPTIGHSEMKRIQGEGAITPASNEEHRPTIPNPQLQLSYGSSAESPAQTTNGVVAATLSLAAVVAVAVLVWPHRR